MSLRKAINEKCRDCIYDPKSGLGTWRQQVSKCPSEDCPLYPYRPLSEDYIRSRKAQNGAVSEVLSDG